MKRYRLTPLAKCDLSSIHKYIARDNLSAADKLFDEIKNKFQLLVSQPLLGQERPELINRLRSFTIGKYVIFYRPTNNGIDIVRVIHAARDINKQF